MDNQNELKKIETKPLAAAPDGSLMGTTLEDQYRLAKYYVQSNMLPKGFDTPEKALIGFQYAIELGLKPLTAMKNICVINGQPNLWGELPLALVRKSGDLEYLKEYFIDKDYKEINLTNKNLDADKWAAVCIIKRKGSEEREFFWTADDVKKAKRGPVWTNYHQVMWKRKIRTIALKDLFGDILGTFDIAEYSNDKSPDVPNTMVDVNTRVKKIEATVDEVTEAEVEPLVFKDADPDPGPEGVGPLKDDKGKVIGEAKLNKDGSVLATVIDPNFKLDQKLQGVSVSGVVVDPAIEGSEKTVRQTHVQKDGKFEITDVEEFVNINPTRCISKPKNVDKPVEKARPPEPKGNPV